MADCRALDVAPWRAFLAGIILPRKILPVWRVPNGLAWQIGKFAFEDESSLMLRCNAIAWRDYI